MRRQGNTHLVALNRDNRASPSSITSPRFTPLPPLVVGLIAPFRFFATQNPHLDFRGLFSQAEFFGLTTFTGAVECRERLGGLLRYYHRKAA
jgi:hypothetical protein